MKFLILSTLAALMISSCIAAPKVNINELILLQQAEKSFDLILSLLPLYGGFKLNRMINQRSIDLIKQFFDKNPHHYDSFKDELSTEGVFLPEYNQINWNALTPDDFAIAKVIVGETTIQQALNEDYVKSIIKMIQSDQQLIDRLNRVKDDIGITLSDNIDTVRLVETLSKTFKPMIQDFIPTAITIVLFGK